MTIEQIIYDIRIILRATTDDSKISDPHLIYKFLNYRPLFISQSFLATQVLNPIWTQRLGNKALTPVNSADNPSIVDGTVQLGKATLPSILPIGPDLGIYQISDSQRQKQVYPTNWPVLMHMISYKDNRLKLFRYYCRIGQELYVYPYINEVDVMAILENPFEAIVFSTEYIRFEDMVQDTEYFVISGSVKELYGETKTVYPKNSTFTADLNNNYSGDGKLREFSQVKDFTYNMQFPIDAGTAQRIVLEILTKDFAIERRMVSDMVNDAADQAYVLTKSTI